MFARQQGQNYRKPGVQPRGFDVVAVLFEGAREYPCNAAAGVEVVNAFTPAVLPLAQTVENLCQAAFVRGSSRQLVLPELQVATANGVGCDRPRKVPEFLGRDGAPDTAGRAAARSGSPSDHPMRLPRSPSGASGLHRWLAGRRTRLRSTPATLRPVSPATSANRGQPRATEAEALGEWTNPPCAPRRAMPGTRATVSRRHARRRRSCPARSEGLRARPVAGGFGQELVKRHATRAHHLRAGRLE